MIRGTINLHIADMPGAMLVLRHEMADVLREVAEEEVEGYTRARLLSIAEAFESDPDTPISQVKES